MKKYFSLSLQFIVVLCAALGVSISAIFSGASAMGSETIFLYFTIQSNIWIAAICLVYFIIGTAEAISGRTFHIPRILWILKFVFTVSITLTGAVFCLVLAPPMPGAFRSVTNILTHAIVPAAAIADLFLCEAGKVSYKFIFFACIPPILYLLFASLGYALGWNFGGGNNYPYFFLNLGSPAGIFGFGDGIYFMGTFYWVIVLLAFISAIAAIYVAILKSHSAHKVQHR